MIKIFIDTNIFLGLYESNDDPITIFEKDISKLRPHLISTDQVYDEFLRNRDLELQQLIKKCKENQCRINSSSIINSLKEFSDLKKIKDHFDETNKLLIKRINNIKDNTERDLVFESFLELYNHADITRYERNEEIIKKAYNRKLLGNPPMGYKQNTIGDEVIWEIILANIKDDLVIITRDGTYEDHITFLKKEFNLKTKKELFIDEKISYALDKIGEIPSEELNKLEEEQSKEKLLLSNLSNYISKFPSSSIASVVESLSRIPSPAISSSSSIAAMIENLSRIPNPAISSVAESLDICPRCKNYGKREGDRCSACGYTW
ncbi:hypothetical protein BROC_00611 [Candidatus Brocadiaceae bacterium]|nr:hypothetical protein BROC_00611 [Candidatus Brocadiaceae bacterium]